jgi:peptidoglycan/LPS O-acetylase OafA/YrhL
VFFTLSAFLLFRPFAVALVEQRPRPSLARYLRNRFLRIFPAYWFILVVSALALRTVLVRDSAYELRAGGLIDDPLTLLRNLLLVQNYDPDTYFTGIGPAWSLAIEIVFYLILPFLAVGAWWIAGKRPSSGRRRLAALMPAVLLLFVGLSGKAAATFIVRPSVGHEWIGWAGNWNSVLERSFWAQADLFSFGLALAVVSAEIEGGTFRLPPWWRKAATAAMLLIAFGTAKLLQDGSIGPHGYQTMMALACGLLLALVVLPSPAPGRTSLFVRVLATPALVSVGVASYSLFLWHEPLIRWMSLHGSTFPGVGGFVGNMFIVAVCAGALSALTYRSIEAPALRWKVRDRPLFAADRRGDTARPIPAPWYRRRHWLKGAHPARR